MQSVEVTTSIDANDIAGAISELPYADQLEIINLIAVHNCDVKFDKLACGMFGETIREEGDKTKLSTMRAMYVEHMKDYKVGIV